MKFLYFLFSITSVFAAKLPDGIILCHKSQPDFSDCVAKNMRGGLLAFSKGYKEFGIPQLDPYFIEKMEIKPGAGNSVSLHQIFTNVNVHGMPDTVIEHLEIDIDKGCSWVMDAVSPLIRFEGDYQLDGKVLVFPLNAHGKCNVSLVNLRNHQSMECEKYEKNGKTHIRIKKFTMQMNPENVLYNFENIFPSNKDIEKEIKQTIRENSLVVFNDVKSAFEEIFATIHLTLTNVVLSKVPMDEIFLP